MARTTLDIDSSVREALRRRSREDGKSMGQVASELLAGALAEERGEPAASPFVWRSADLGVPSVDLDDKAALRRVLDTP